MISHSNVDKLIQRLDGYGYYHHCFVERAMDEEPFHIQVDEMNPAGFLYDDVMIIKTFFRTTMNCVDYDGYIDDLENKKGICKKERLYDVDLDVENLC